jgi:hypothetical protein
VAGAAAGIHVPCSGLTDEEYGEASPRVKFQTKGRLPKRPRATPRPEKRQAQGADSEVRSSVTLLVIVSYGNSVNKRKVSWPDNDN